MPSEAASSRYVVITGPTASGKSALVTALAGRFPGQVEVVNADAFQVYRGLDIGTAKPGLAERSAFPHHLYDFLDPAESLNVGLYVRMARQAIAAILQRGHLPVVCGGTQFYIKHLLYGVPESPPADPVVRRQLEERLADRGQQALHQELAAVDPASAARIHLNDVYRVLRALEVYQVSGRPLSSYAMSPASGPPDGRLFCLELPRDALLERIGHRCRQMAAAGLEAEVWALAAQGYSPDDPGLRAIGYREFFAGIPGDWRLRPDLTAVWAEVELHTRQYAKRQMTFIRGLAGTEALVAGAGQAGQVPDALLQACESLICR